MAYPRRAFGSGSKGNRALAKKYGTVHGKTIFNTPGRIPVLSMFRMTFEDSRANTRFAVIMPAD